MMNIGRIGHPLAADSQAPRPVDDAAGGPLRKGTQSKKVELPPPIIDAGLDGALRVWA